MVQSLAAGLPMDQGEVRAIVVGVALDAIFARSLRSYPHRMHAAILCEAVSDFGVAI
jgi:hypothetical protein